MAFQGILKPANWEHYTRKTMEQLDTWQLVKLFEKQANTPEQVQKLIDIDLANRNDGRFEMDINPNKGDLARGNERVQRVYVRAQQLMDAKQELDNGPLPPII